MYSGRWSGFELARAVEWMPDDCAWKRATGWATRQEVLLAEVWRAVVAGYGDDPGTHPALLPPTEKATGLSREQKLRDAQRATAQRREQQTIEGVGRG